MNNKGSILILTLTFIFVFILLGLGTIYQAGAHNRDAEKKRASMEAFWLADGAVQKAKNKIQKTPPVLVDTSDPAVALGRGTYDVYSATDPYCLTCLDRWVIRSEGLVQGQKRMIEAIAAKYDIDKALTTKGGVKDFDKCPMASITIDCAMVEEYLDFSFETVLNGITQADIVAAATRTYLNPANAGAVNPIEQVTVIYLTGNNNSLSLTTDNLVGEAFLLIDLSGVTSNGATQINISGNPDFRGVIWIIGEAELKGTAAIQGAVFVQGQTSLYTKVSGNVSLTFNAPAIRSALNHIGHPYLDTPEIISWREI